MFRRVLVREFNIKGKYVDDFTFLAIQMLEKVINIVTTKKRLNDIKNEKALNYLELKADKILLFDGANSSTEKNKWRTSSHSDHFCVAISSRVSGHFLVMEFLQSFDPAVVEHLIFSNHVI